MIRSGRFETSTKTKISTPHGTILKVTRYDEESYSDVEYRIRPKCKYCGDPIDCLCFNDQNSEQPYKDTVENLQIGWICEKNECIIKYQKEDDPVYYEYLRTTHNGNESAIADAVSDGLATLNVGDFCLHL